MDFNKFVIDTWKSIFVEKNIYSIEYSLFLKNKETLQLFTKDIFNISYFSEKENQKILEEKTIDLFAFLRTIKELSLKYKYKILNEDFLREVFTSLGFYIHTYFDKEQLQKLTDIIYIYKNKGTSEIIEDLLNNLVGSKSYEVIEYFLFENKQIKNLDFTRSLPVNKLQNDPLWYTNINQINLYPVKLPYFSILKNENYSLVNSSFIYLYALILLELRVFSTEIPKNIYHPLLKEPISIPTALVLINCIYSIIFKDLLPNAEMIDRKIAIYKKFKEDISFENVEKNSLILSLQNLFDLFDFSLYDVIADFVLQNKYRLSVLMYSDLTEYIISNWTGYTPLLYPVINSLSQEIYPKLTFIFFYNLILQEQKPIDNLLNFNWDGNYTKYIHTRNYFYENIMDLVDFYKSLPTSYFINKKYTSQSIGFSLLQLLDDKLFSFVSQLETMVLSPDQKWTLINFCTDLLNKIFAINKIDIKISNLSSHLINEFLKFLKPIYTRIPDSTNLNVLNIIDRLRNTLVIGDGNFLMESILTFYDSIFTGKFFFNYKRTFTKEEITSKYLNLDQYLISLDSSLKLDQKYYIYTPSFVNSNNIYFGGSDNPFNSPGIYPVTESFDKNIITDAFLENNSSFIKEQTNETVEFYSTNELEPLFVYLTKINIPILLKNRWKNKIDKIVIHKSIINPTQIKGTKIVKTTSTSTIPIIDKNKKLTNNLFSSTLNLGTFIAQFDDTSISHLKNIVENNASYFTTTQSDMIIIESTFYPVNDVPFIDFIKTKLTGYL